MQFLSLKRLAVVAGLGLGTAGNLCIAIDNAVVDDQSGALHEIVVTARRRNEDLEKVGLNVAALSTSALAEQHITNEQELQTAVPGLLTVASTSTNQLAFSIRGQAVDAFSYTSPTVLTYFNEFQTGGTTATTFFDLQSVQVLKGPQGTLFGRNATGGAILYTSTQPGKALEGYFNYTAGNFNEQKVEGAVTIPLADWASVRLAAEDEHQHAGLAVGAVRLEILQHVLLDELLGGPVAGLGIGDDGGGVFFREFLAGGEHACADDVEAGPGNEARDDAAGARFTDRVGGDDYVR